jgi:hypothetical protein
VLISRDELADEMIAAMDGNRVCLLVGHGITVACSTLSPPSTSPDSVP